MPYSIKLPDGTLVQNIPDDVDPSAAKAKLSAQMPDLAPQRDLLSMEGLTSLSNRVSDLVAQPFQRAEVGRLSEQAKEAEDFAANLRPEIAASEWGLKQRKKAGELRNQVGLAQDALRETTDRLAQQAPRNPSYPYKVAEMVAGNLPSTVGSAATAGLASGGNPALATAAGVATLAQGVKQQADIAKQAAFAPQEGEGKALNLQEGKLHAFNQGLAEGIPELLPLGEAVKAGKKPFMEWFKSYIGKDLVGEEVTTVWQKLSDHAAKTPNEPLGKFMKDLGSQMVDTAAVTAVQGGVTGATAKVAKSSYQAPELPEGATFADVLAQDRLLRPVVERAQQAHLNSLLSKAADNIDVAAPAPMSDPAHTQNAGATYDELLRKFKDQNLPDGMWSEFAGQYGSKTGITIVPTTSTTEEVLAATNAAMTTNPVNAHQFVMANLDTLEKANISIPNVVQDLVNSKQLSEDAGKRIIDSTTNAMNNIVAGLEKVRSEAKKRYAAEVEAFVASAPTVDDVHSGEFEKTQQALEAALGALQQRAKAAGASIGNTPPLSYRELIALGVPDSAAFYLSDTRFNGSDQAIGLQRTANLISELTGKLSAANGPRLSPAAFGVHAFMSKLAGTLRSLDVHGDVIDFGPLRGKKVNDYLLDPANAGMVNIIDKTPPGTDPKFAKRIYAITSRWVKKYAPKMQLIVSVGEGRSFMQMPHENVLRLHIDSAKSPNDVVLALAHEFGHALFLYRYHQATAEVREALRLEWVNHLKENWDKPYGNFQKATFRGGYANYSPDTTLAGAIYKNAIRPHLTGQEVEAADYIPNFKEWHAGMMEKMLAGDYQQMTKPVRTFWRAAFTALQNFFTQEHKLWNPSQTIQQFLELMKGHDTVADATSATQDQLSQAFNLGLSGTTIPNLSETITISGVGEAVAAQPAGNLGGITAANSAQQPTSQSPIMGDFVQSVKALGKAAKKADPVNGPAITQSVVKFNEMWAKMLGSFQILGLNKDVPGAQRFLEALRAKFGYKSQWLRHANRLANKWEGLGKVQAGAVAKLMLMEAETETWFSQRHNDPANPGHYIFVLDPEKAKEFGVDEAGAVVYSQARNMFMRALDAMEALGRERITRQFRDDPLNPQMAAQLQELQSSYAAMRDKPYTPFSRFGQFYVKIKAKDNGIFKDPYTNHSKFYTAGQTVYFETFETQADRDAALPQLQQRYGKSPMLDAQFNTGKIHDIVYSARNLPPEFARAIAERLDLTEEQLREYNELLKDLASDSSFVKHMKRKANISGYSPDVLRGFADYFMRFANNYAKGKSAPEFEAAMADVREFKRQLEAAETDTTKLDEFYNWMQRTFNYVMNPGSEMAELKSFVTAWYLGFNIPTAAQNITQLGFWTLPYLSKRFGTVKTLAVMKTALQDVLGSWRSLSRLSEDEKAAMTYAMEQGFIDESFATSIAQFAEGTALTRLTATATRHRVLNSVNHKALYMFQLTEEINRRTSLLAAYRLNRSEDFKAQGADAFDRAAFQKAREAVEVTQNEYALENRPEFMRGNKSLIFQFMHYVQNAIFRMTPWGDESWKRLLLMQLAVGGLLGLPFAEDLLNFAKFLARKFGQAFEPELLMRQLLTDLNMSPDLVLRGAMSHAGPFDLSYRYSLGQVVPGMQALGSSKPFTDAIFYAAGDVGGAGATIALNAMKAVANIDDPNKLKTFQYIAPSFVKYILQAISAANEGGVIARNGAMLAPLDATEITGMGFGLQPRAKSVAYQKIGFESEVRNYWMTRRATLLDNMYEARRTHDREAIADVRKRLRDYNIEARKVDKALVIGSDTLQRSMAQRKKAAKKQERDGSPYNNKQLTRMIDEAVQEE